MGLVTMSERELRRVEVIAQVEDGRLTAAQAAGVLGVSERTVFRLAARMRDGGPSALRHAGRGRPSNNKVAERVREYAIGLIRESYADYGPTLAAEVLAERHGLTVSRETVRKWMVADGLWKTRKERRRFQQPRLRRERFGELVQIDGSEHRWFEDRGPVCSLLVFIDDATGRLMQLRFCEAESTFAYMDALEGYLEAHGRPLAFYSDKHSVFRIARPSQASGETRPEFGRALAELQIEIICADTSQAKGRVERANRTLQDRLVKALRIEGIATIQDGNAFLPRFVASFNGRFAREPAKPDDLHRTLGSHAGRLRDVLCLKDQRKVSRQLTLTYERKRVILEPGGTADDLVGAFVDVHEYPDGSFDVRWRGEALPHRVHDERQQRVTHAAITENKRLSAVLAHIKERQDAGGLPPPQIKRASAKNGYTRTGRKPGVAPGTSRLAARKTREAAARVRTPAASE